jgi:hypothetical protein
MLVDDPSRPRLRGQASIIVNFDLTCIHPRGPRRFCYCFMFLRTEFGRYVVLPHHPVRRRRFPSGAEGIPIGIIGCDLIRDRAMCYPKS